MTPESEARGARRSQEPPELGRLALQGVAARIRGHGARLAVACTQRARPKALPRAQSCELAGKSC